MKRPTVTASDISALTLLFGVNNLPAKERRELVRELTPWANTIWRAHNGRSQSKAAIKVAKAFDRGVKRSQRIGRSLRAHHDARFNP